MVRTGPPIGEEHIEWKGGQLFATEARKARNGKVMASAARKKVNIRTRTRIQARMLFAGTALRKAI